MRRLVIASACFLIVTGLILTWQDSLPIDEEDLFISLLHIWVGFFFIVIFPMYAIDHLNAHRSRLTKFFVDIAIWILTTDLWNRSSN